LKREIKMNKRARVVVERTDPSKIERAAGCLSTETATSLPERKIRFTKCGLFSGFTGLGFLLLVLVLVGQARPIASQRAILTASHLPVEADTIVEALTVAPTGAGLSAPKLVRTNTFVPRQPGPPLPAAAPFKGDSSGHRERTATNVLKQEGSYESQEKALIPAHYGLRPKEQDSVSSGNLVSNSVPDFDAPSRAASPRLTPGGQVKSDSEREMRLSGSSSGDQLEGVTESDGAVSGNRNDYPRGAVTKRGVNDPRGPICEITKVATDATGKKFIEVTAQDSGSGLASIRVVTTTTTNVTVTIPSFPVGTTGPVVVIATQINESEASRLELEVGDLDGNITRCDPVITTLELSAVLPPSESPSLSISVSDGMAKVRWMTKGTLQSAKSVTGPWSIIDGATSPFTAPAAGTTFYRVRQ
jgi:hypothetical protein